MQFEIEQKHAVNDLPALVARLSERGIEIAPAVIQVDRFFAHPARNFAETDEALRIRTVGGESFVTYKGPRLDPHSKTRREIELPLDANDGEGRQFAELLAALGFVPAATVRKARRTFSIRHGGTEVSGALDDVDGVGQYVELELMADAAGVDAAKRVIAAVAAELQLGPPERRSYLELLVGR
jgi:adenylate cyclase class 2